MMTTRPSRLVFVLLAAVLLAPVGAWAERPHGKPEHRPDDLAGLVIFGDSLSDTGNKFIETGLVNRPPYDLLDEFLIPDGPYARGGLNHSNGALWIEQLARPLGLGKDVRPSLSSRKQGNNYAYGGARARDASSTSPNRHLPTQVNDFMADVNHSPSAEPLYVLFIGGNDVVDAVRALAIDPTGATSVGIIIEALTSISDSVQTLYNFSQGAREFLVFNSPDLGLTPAFNPPLNIEDAPVLGTCFTLLFNLGGDESVYPSPYDLVCTLFNFPPIPGFAAIISKLEADLSGTTFTRIDSFALFRDIVENPRAYRLRNVTDACIMPNVPPYACRRPDSYLFWDGVHPTRKGHAIIARYVKGVIKD